MSGAALFDSGTLQILAQQRNMANAPYLLAPNAQFNMEKPCKGVAAFFSPQMASTLFRRV